MGTHVYIATSLDGYIADSQGGLQWLFDIPNPSGSDYGYAEFMSDIDAILMGRGTYETVLQFDAWPYQKPCYVATSKPLKAPSGIMHSPQFLQGTPSQMQQLIHADGHEHIYIDGGQLISSFLRDDLIDTLTLSRVPVILGSGKPLFAANLPKLGFEHLGTESFGPLIKSRYRRQCQI
jgi:dihydrofolate reductase